MDAEAIAKFRFPKNDQSVHPHAAWAYCKLILDKNHPMLYSLQYGSGLARCRTRISTDSKVF